MRTGPNIHVHEFCSEFLPGTGPPVVGLGRCAIVIPCIHRRAAVSKKQHVSQLQPSFHPYQTCNANVGDPEWSGCSGEKGDLWRMVLVLQGKIGISMFQLH